jgi:hypothetical protein
MSVDRGQRQRELVRVQPFELPEYLRSEPVWVERKSMMKVRLSRVGRTKK